jgi:hypothetical protein
MKTAAAVASAYFVILESKYHKGAQMHEGLGQEHGPQSADCFGAGPGMEVDVWSCVFSPSVLLGRRYKRVAP